MAKKNPLIRKKEKSYTTPLPNQSAGILDDHAVRKVLHTKELNVATEAIFNNSVTLKSGVPTLVFDDTHAGHDKYRIRIDNDTLCFGAGSPNVDNFCLDSVDNSITFMGKVKIDGMSQGSIPFAGSDNDLTTNPTRFIWDNTNFRHKVEGDYVVSKVDGQGIRVDTAIPTFGWRDLLGELQVKNTGATKPTFTTYRNTIQEFQFAAGNEEYLKFHIPHDYVKGTDIFLHFHWSHISTLVTGGSAVWGIEAIYAKGHNQAAFPASVTKTKTSTASTTQYQHMIDELQLSISGGSATQLDTDDLEPDGVLICRVALGANNITSSGAVPDPFLHFADVHYQSTNIGTKDKVPDFYT